MLSTLHILSNLIFTITLRSFIIANYRQTSNVEETVFERVNISLHISQSRKSKSSLPFSMVCIVNHTFLWHFTLCSAKLSILISLQGIQCNGSLCLGMLSPASLHRSQLPVIEISVQMSALQKTVSCSFVYVYLSYFSYSFLGLGLRLWLGLFTLYSYLF